MCLLYHCRPLWAFEWFIFKEHIGGFCFLVENAECWRIVNFFHSQLYMKVFPSRTPSKLIWVVWDPAKDTQIRRKIGVWRSTLWGRRWKYKSGSVFILGDCVYFIDFYFFPTCFCAQVCCVYLQRGERLRNWSHNLWHPFAFDETSILRDIRCFGPFFFRSGLQFETISQCYQGDSLLNNLTYMSSYKSVFLL